LDSDEGAPLRGRHLEFFLQFAEQAEPKLHSAEQLIWLNQLGAEYENLRAALEWARETGSTQPALRLAKATEQLADVRCLLGAGTQAIPLYQRALELWQSVHGADPMFGARVDGKILRTVANMMWTVDLDRYKAVTQTAASSRASLETGWGEIESLPPDTEKVRLLTTLSRDASRIREPADWDLAETYARRAVEAAEALDSPVELSAALGSLDAVYLHRGLWREHAQLALQRLELSRDARFSDQQERASVLVGMGKALMSVGDYVQAIPHLLEAENLAGQMQAVDLEKWALDVRTYCLFQLDRWAEMLKTDEKLRDMQQRYPREQVGPSCFSVGLIAAVHALRGERDLAAAQRKEADAIMTDIGGPHEYWERPQHY